MSDWSSFNDDKKHMDAWREFLSEDKNKSDKEQLDEVSFLQSIGLQKMDPEEQKQINALADKIVANPNALPADINPKTGARTTNAIVGSVLAKYLQMFGIPTNNYNALYLMNALVNKFSDLGGGEYTDRIDLLIPAIKRASKQIKQNLKKQAEEEREAEEEVEADEESTSFFDRVRDMGAKAKDTMTKKRSFFSKKSNADAEEYPASGFASLYKTLDDINKRLKVADRDTLYDELEKLFKDQNFVVQESQIMIEAPGEIEGGALILGRNPQFDLESYPALSKLVQSAATNAQLAQALKNAFVGAGFEGVNVSPAAEPEAPAAPAEPEAAKPPDRTMPSGAEPPVRPMPSGAEPPVRPMPQVSSEDLYKQAVEIVINNQNASNMHLQRKMKEMGLNLGYNTTEKLLDQMEKEGIIGPKPGDASEREVYKKRKGSRAQKFEPSAATAAKQRGSSKKGDYSVLPQSTTRASKIGAGAYGPNKGKAIKEDALVEHWQKLAGIIKG